MYVFASAFSFLLIHASVHYFPTGLTIFTSSLIAAILFHLANFNKIIPMYKKCFDNKVSWMKILVLMLINWITAIYGNTLSFPFVYIFFYFCSISTFGFLYLNKVESNSLLEKSMHKYSKFSISCLVGLMSIYFLVNIFEILSMNHVTHSDIAVKNIIGSILGVAGGISGYFYGKESQLFSIKTKLTTSQILAVRFWLMILLSYFLIPNGIAHYYSVKNMIYVFLIAIFSFVLPVYFNQKGILDVGAEKNSIIRGLTPLTTDIFQSIYLNTFQMIDFLISLLPAIFVSIPFLANYINSRKLSLDCNQDDAESRMITNKKSGG